MARKPKPTVIIREEYPGGTRQFQCVDDCDAATVLHEIRTLSRSRPENKQSTFYTGRVTWSEGYK